MKRINLALQGGGAHGAFTWGVLDRLLDETDVEVAAITGTSAGALNGAAFKSGMVKGGARRRTRDVELASGARWALLVTCAWPIGCAGSNRRRWRRPWNTRCRFPWPTRLSRMVSPYAYGPFYVNPLKSVVDAFDFDNICVDEGPELFICATRVRTGKIRIFQRDEISSEAILASACLPTLFKAVEIDDPETGRREAYWDGGYTGNPALFPLFNTGLPDDVVVVNINPLERDELPVTPQQIHNRGERDQL